MVHSSARNRSLGLAALALLVLAGCATPTQSPAPTADPGSSGTAPASGGATPPGSSAGCQASPALTIGPYYLDAKDRSDVRSGTSAAQRDEAAGNASGEGDPATEGTEAADETAETPTAEYVDARERSDILLDAAGAQQEGAVLRLTVQLQRYAGGACVPLQGAKVDVWHANAAGKYSGFAQEGTAGQDWLRGWQTSDASGQVHFTTIWPGWYPGRAVHIHVRVRLGTDATDFTSQFFFDEAMSSSVYQAEPYRSHGTTPDTPNARDGIYSQGGNRMILVTTGSDGSYTGTKTVVVP